MFKVWRLLSKNSVEYTGEQKSVWRCLTRIQKGPTACDVATIVEDDLHQVAIKAINKLLQISPNVKRTLLENIKVAIADNSSIELKTVIKL